MRSADDDGAPPASTAELTLGERFGRNLWRSRRRACLSQEELASLAGLTCPHISLLERGLRLPCIDTILKLAAATDVPVCVLLAGMEWQPGRVVDGNFHVEHPAATLRRSVRR